MQTRCYLGAAVLATASVAVPVAAQPATALPAGSSDTAALRAQVQEMAAEMAEMKAELAALRQQQSQAQPQAAAAAAPASGWDGKQQAAAGGAAASSPAPMADSGSASGAGGPATVFSGYGEIDYTRPTRRSQDAELDVRRFVIGVEHRFDDKTKMVGELEVEHAVTSASDPGEVAVEQAYVEHRFSPTWAGRAGLFLMPTGLLNENHEPTAYYGVHRNFVETAIIPTTWREGGVQAIGTFDNGLTLQGGVSTSFNLNKWDAASTEGLTSPLGSIHQEGALAKARNVAVFGAANWRGVPGLLLGGSVFTGGATQGQAGQPNSRVSLWDLHARWTPGNWDLAALYAQGNISNTAAFNAPLVGSATLVPSRFDGGYVQAAYHVWRRGAMSLTPFVRLGRFNTAAAYANLGTGLTPAASPAERVLTLGANFTLAEGVVLKVDWQTFKVNKDANRVDLGLGWSF